MRTIIVAPVVPTITVGKLRDYLAAYSEDAQVVLDINAIKDPTCAYANINQISLPDADGDNAFILHAVDTFRLAQLGA